MMPAVKFKSIKEAGKVLGLDKLICMSGDMAEFAAPTQVNIQFCKNHPEVEAHKNKHGRYMGLCLECLRERAIRNRQNRGGKVPQEKQEDSPFDYSGLVPPDNHPDVRPLYGEGTSPLCKNHPDRPAKIDKLGRSMGLCPDCLSERGLACGIRNHERGLTSPPVAIPLNQAKYAEIKRWLEEQAAENERSLLQEIMYRLKLSMREATVLGVTGRVLILLLLMTGNVWAQESPRIGRLTMPAPWWEIIKDAARKNGISPYWIASVIAIESRYNRFCINKRHKCYGLMQLQEDVARDLGVTDPFDAEQNIRAGAAILGRLDKKYGGDKLKILKAYNPTDAGAYSREVMRAWRQARRNR